MFFSLVHKMNWVFLLVLLLSSVGKCDEDNEEDKQDIGLDEDQETVEEDPVAASRNIKPPVGMEPLRFRPANLTEEETHSVHMPTELKCDGCRIIAYQATRRLKRVQDRYKNGHRLLESDVIDILDGVCNDEGAFDGYGIKEVKGEKRLAGDGLETNEEPGLLQGGGRWPHRLRLMCEQFVGNLGEDVIYETFLENESLEQFFCYSEENGNVCNPEAKKTKKAKKEL